jgi:hypothetical protein
MRDLESSTGQQMLRLEPKQISHRESVHEALFSPVWMSDVVDQFEVVDLVETIACNRLVTARNPSPIWHRELRLVATFFANRTDEEIERWIEDVQNEDAVIGQVSVNVRQAGELVFDGQQVLKGPKRNRDQGEPVVKAEVSHVSLDQSHSLLYCLRFVKQTLTTHGKHVRRQVQPNDVYSRAGRRNENTPGPTPNLQYRTPSPCCGVDEESDIRPVAIGYNVVVQIGDERVILVSAAPIQS